MKVQISHDRDYKPGFLEAVKKRFVEIVDSSRLNGKGSKIGSSFSSREMGPGQNLPYRFGDAGPTPCGLMSLV